MIIARLKPPGIFDWRRPVVAAHRWLGIAFGLFFAAWFASGIVMMYAGMPRLSPGERRARLEPLDLSTAGVSPLHVQLAQRIGDIEEIRVGMLLRRPVYRMRSGGRWTTVFADTGERLDRLGPSQATEEARRFAAGAADAVRYDARLDQPDQWTLEMRGALPLHRVAIGDPDDTYLYVSEQSGEVVQKTTAPERRVAYAGAVLHWLYFTPFRRHPRLWSRTITGMSLAGTVMCLLGLVWGIYSGVPSPYRGWMRWHHTAGLAFGVVTLTWIFSGLLSMDPWDWHPSTDPTRAQREAFSGGPLALDDVTVPEIRRAVSRLTPSRSDDDVDSVRPKHSRSDPVEVEIVPFHGRPRFLVDGRPADPPVRDELLAAARNAMPASGIVDAVSLGGYDNYYYDRQRELPLPVLRIRYADPQHTWLYVDLARGSVVRREVTLTRLNRWLYHGLHRLDFPFLYARRPLWDIVVITLSLGGAASVVTAASPAWRRVRRHAARLFRGRGRSAP